MSRIAGANYLALYWRAAARNALGQGVESDFGAWRALFDDG